MSNISEEINGIKGCKIDKILINKLLISNSVFGDILSPYFGLTISKNVEQKSSHTNLYVIIKASEILKLSKALSISITLELNSSLNHLIADISNISCSFLLETSKPLISLYAFHILFEKFFPCIHSFLSNNKSFPAGAENKSPILTPSAP